jgi:hypothetical protein
MRSVIASGLVLISLGFLLFPAPSPAVAEEICRCKGCGCKGGSGWRGPDGFCVSQTKLAEVCGTRPASRRPRPASVSASLSREDMLLT